MNNQIDRAYRIITTLIDAERRHKQWHGFTERWNDQARRINWLDPSIERL